MKNYSTTLINSSQDLNVKELTIAGRNTHKLSTDNVVNIYSIAMESHQGN